MDSRTLIKAVTTLGPRWALTRSKLALKTRLGLLERRTPLCNWEDIKLRELLKPEFPYDPYELYAWRIQHMSPFFFASHNLDAAKSFVGRGALRLADGILEGKFPFFGEPLELGFPPEWQNERNGTQTSPAHWSSINEFDAGDIKLTWEPSRFSWSYTLARAYRRTSDERYASAFWTLLESWLHSNPPNSGVNWKCGQEASFRVMALCFGLYAFVQSSASTPERIAAFLIAMAAHANRIDAYIEYATSQKNNHGISEGIGLLTVGLLFPEFKESDRWKARGREVIERETDRQIYADGSYVQHSINYHRVMLQDLAWGLRLGELNNFPLSRNLYKKFRASIGLLRELTDRESGHAPNCGANDGALVLPLTDCEFPDMRPVLQSCYFLTEQKRLYPPGPWDEEMAWLNGVESLSASQASNQPVINLEARSGGYYSHHSTDSWIMLRAASYQDRPSHADELHLDMWWHGENVLCDPGSYSYNAPSPFDHAFASSRFHNSVVIDDADQMSRLSRFLWVDWAKALVKSYDLAGGQRVLEAEHDGYAKRYGVRHRRSIVCPEPDTWVIVDDIIGTGTHQARLHWLTPDIPLRSVDLNTIDLEYRNGIARLFVATNAEGRFDVVRAGQQILGKHGPSLDASRGWLSRYYARKEPAVSIALDSSALLPIRFITVFMLQEQSEIKASKLLDHLQVRSTQCFLSKIGTSPVFALIK